jgi:hypothetical protein
MVRSAEARDQDEEICLAVFRAAAYFFLVSTILYTGVCERDKQLQTSGQSSFLQNNRLSVWEQDAEEIFGPKRDEETGGWGRVHS